MAEITASLVKELRERTGAGMMDCKKALTEANGDIELAIENMRKSGAIKAAKKAGNVAADGVIKTKIEGNYGYILEVNCQTDFVAKDAGFQAFADKVLDAAVAGKITDVEVLKAQFEEERVALVAKIGENINIRRVAALEGDVLGSYQHGARIGVLVAAKSGGKLLSARGNLMADKRTNRLLIRDDARHLPALKAWAQEMDLPVGQVELAAHIVSMSETSLRELGVKWRLAEAESTPGSGHITTLSSDLSVNDASTRAGFNIGKINGRLLELELSALERKQQVEIIASPRLLASHMQPASIKQGSEIPYQVSSGESGATSVEFKEAVLGMEVTPTVLQQGRVRLKLRISENTPGQVLKQENGEALAIDKQEIETLVEVRSGETLALGGIFSQKNKTARDSVPLLGDIPVLGRLFRRDGKDNERRELVVFITPRILAVR